MMKIAAVTVINEPGLRGVLAPPSIISEDLLEDLVDFITLSSRHMIRSLEARVADADRRNAWRSAADVTQRSKTRHKSRA